MTEDWNSEIIDELCNVEYGTRVVRKYDSGTIYPVYGGGGKTFSIDTFNRENRLVVSRFAMSEKCTRFINDKFFLNDSGLTISTKNPELINQKFIDYQILSLNDTIYSIGRGTAQRNLNLGSFRKLKLNFPDTIEEQKQIIEILDDTLSSIDKAKANVEKNIKNTKELFQSKLNQIFSQTGEGWEEKSLDDVCEIISGGTPKTSIKDYWGGGVAWITPSDMGKLKNKEVFKTRREISKIGLAKSSAKLLPINSVILSTRAPIGHIAINTVPMSTNQGCRGLVVTSKIDKFFLYYFLLSNVKLLNNLGRGTTFKELSKKALGTVKISLCSINNQKIIINKLEQIETLNKSLVSNYEKELENLEELKKSILQKAFTGELTSKNDLA